MKVKIQMPSSLADIKLSQYQKFIRTTDGKEDVNFINRQLVSIFCHIKDEYIGQIRKADYDEMIEQVTNILNTQSAQLQTIIKHNGIDYGFIPKNFEDITVSELADLDNYIKDVQTYDKAMSVLYRPIKTKLKKQYLIEDYEAKGEGLDLTMDVVTGALVFFSTLINDLLNCTQNSITEAVQTDKRLQSLVESGGGIKTFTDLVGEVFLNLKTSVN
jgi:hypothetical protein